MTRRARAAALPLLLMLPAALAQAQPRPDALAELQRGNYERAAEIGMGEIAAGGRGVDSYVALCRALIALGRHEEALRFANMARAANRHDPRVIGILGEIYFSMGNNAGALRYFQHYLTVSPEGSRAHMAHYFVGEIFIRTGRFRRADIALTAAVHMAPGNAEWWARLAFARENAGDLAQAVAAYERALALDPRLADARRGLDRVRAALR